MSNELLLTGGLLWDGIADTFHPGDLGICDGRFVSPATLKHPETIDLSGLLVCPGFIDLHVHLREPGQTWKETIRTGTLAARKGGFTTIVSMPNTIPPIDTPERLQELESMLAKDAAVRVVPSVCLTRDRAGHEPVDVPRINQLHPHWVYSDDGTTPQDADVMRRVMRAVAAVGGVVIDHCEDKRLSAGGVMHEGRLSAALGLKGQPRSAEESIVQRDIALCRETGCRLHLQHLSSAGSVELLRHAQEEGLPVTGEVTPHHLLLTDEACTRYGTNAKMAPPLREESDRLALIDAVRTGIITAIASDHAPHTREEKAQGWEKAPFGISGIEAEVPLTLTELVSRQNLPLATVLKCFTMGPRQILGWSGTPFAEGEPADATILDIHAVPYPIRVADFLSMGKNCPYDGMESRFRVHSVLLAGKLTIHPNTP